MKGIIILILKMRYIVTCIIEGVPDDTTITLPVPFIFTSFNNALSISIGYFDEQFRQYIKTIDTDVEFPDVDISNIIKNNPSRKYNEFNHWVVIELSDKLKLNITRATLYK